MRTFLAAGLLSVAAAVMGAGTASAADGPKPVEVESGSFDHKAGQKFMNVGGKNGITYAADFERHSGAGFELESGH
ncbi:hypothetical protein ACLGIH_02475 [Streptomyces sp. HMX87]|uniref:hypothetical protein n=1 Tax=Streptomyces sp. HMX87 TaxID=3390849 RepID=UPI003A8BE9C5